MGLPVTTLLQTLVIHVTNNLTDYLLFARDIVAASVEGAHHSIWIATWPPCRTKL